jgi:hypothetical protein
VPVMAPAHLFRLDFVDFGAGGHGGMNIRARPRAVLGQRTRRQRRGLRASGKGRGAG